jgi:p-aminobenzoyl-glutamate transporter AbgT
MSQWFTMVLYGYTSILFAYCVSLLSSSALAAFAIVAAWQVVMFMSVELDPPEPSLENLTTF